MFLNRCCRFGFSLLIASLCCSLLTVGAQEEVAKPADADTQAVPALAPERMEWFQDQKFGLFLHWGIYSELGCIESWPLVWADRKWSNPELETLDEMLEFRRKYWALNQKFSPAKFDPKQWVSAAEGVGMKYVMFTTKHHDGFCMFDTKQTDYKVTADDCPFSRNPKSNIAKHVFDAFRREGFGIGCYFSKSDWDSPYCWSPESVPLDRNPNYDHQLPVFFAGSQAPAWETLSAKLCFDYLEAVEGV